MTNNTSSNGSPTDTNRELVPSRYCRYKFNPPIDPVTLWRWIKAGTIPQPTLVIRGRNYWARETIDAALARMSRPADAA